MAVLILVQSDSVSRPLRMRVESTRASEQMMRWVSSRWLISSEKNSTGRSAWRATLLAMPRAKAVLPALGRAPMTMRALGWRPEVSESRSR